MSRNEEIEEYIQKLSPYVQWEGCEIGGAIHDLTNFLDSVKYLQGTFEGVEEAAIELASLILKEFEDNWTIVESEEIIVPEPYTVDTTKAVHNSEFEEAEGE